MKSTLLCLISLTFVSAGAHGATVRQNVRDKNQEIRIERGEQSGSLTATETKTLEKRAEHIENAEERASEDGKVTRSERAHVQRMQNRESRAIARKKNNRR